MNGSLSRVLQHEDIQKEIWRAGKLCFFIWLMVIRLFLFYENLIELLLIVYVIEMCPALKNLKNGDMKMKVGMEFSLERMVGEIIYTVTEGVAPTSAPALAAPKLVSSWSSHDTL